MRHAAAGNLLSSCHILPEGMDSMDMKWIKLSPAFFLGVDVLHVHVLQLPNTWGLGAQKSTQPSGVWQRHFKLLGWHELGGHLGVRISRPFAFGLALIIFWPILEKILILSWCIDNPIDINKIQQIIDNPIDNPIDDPIDTIKDEFLPIQLIGRLESVLSTLRSWKNGAVWLNTEDSGTCWPGSFS